MTDPRSRSDATELRADERAGLQGDTDAARRALASMTRLSWLLLDDEVVENAQGGDVPMCQFAGDGAQGVTEHELVDRSVRIQWDRRCLDWRVSAPTEFLEPKMAETLAKTLDVAARAARLLNVVHGSHVASLTDLDIEELERRARAGDTIAAKLLSDGLKKLGFDHALSRLVRLLTELDGRAPESALARPDGSELPAGYVWLRRRGRSRSLVGIVRSQGKIRTFGPGGRAWRTIWDLDPTRTLRTRSA